ncbi:hypothetical protein MF672_027425 [Actinomadura sp. ATCC 31491]|uniref:Uncharacterized protein n=1 Tax=Actinomadura luzonensis TaxID=2805427 RepID=A0ABT0FYS1_9ACTN|nr:hypothetical protein [Actinomadura luzonensis]MCK2217493.1 hypothetical protein [Actinomadura luzonensis]
MLLTEMPPPPGAVGLSALRAGERAARRGACVALTACLALLAATQVLADRSPAEQAPPLAALSLAIFVTALPVLAVTQYVWGARARRVRRRERELYAVERSGRARPLSRLAVAACWALTLLLGFTLPHLFRRAALEPAAGVLTWSAEALTVAGAGTGVWFVLWWARDLLGMLTRARRPGGSPGDPWDPGPGTRPRTGAALWAGATLAVAALVGARAHLWEPATGWVYALLTAALVCGVVTDE